MSDPSIWTLCEDCFLVLQRFKAGSDQTIPPPSAEGQALRLGADIFQLIGRERMMVVVPIKDYSPPRDPNIGQKLAEFERRISISGTKSAEVLCCLGEANLSTADELHQARALYIERAIQFFERALSVKPAHEKSHFRLLGAYMSKHAQPGEITADLMNKNVDRATMRAWRCWFRASPPSEPAALAQIQAQDEMLSVPKTIPEAISKSKSLSEDGHLDEAIMMLEAALTNFGPLAELRKELGRVLVNRAGAYANAMQLPESAFKDVCRATELDVENENSFAQNALFILADERGDFDLALQAARKSLVLDSTARANPQFSNRLASVEQIVSQVSSRLPQPIVS